MIASDSELGVGFEDRQGTRWEIVFNPDQVGLVAVRQPNQLPPAAPQDLRISK
jgi:hypothetical protein